MIDFFFTGPLAVGFVIFLLAVATTVGIYIKELFK